MLILQKKIILCFVFFLLVSISIPSSCLANTYHVPGSFDLTIQQAIETASDGDTILVAPGTYFENINFLGKAVVVKSRLGPGVTIIDGGQAGSVVTFENRENAESVLQGFTLTNGYATEGGGIYCWDFSMIVIGSNPTLSGNIITANTAVNSGAGICCKESAPIIIDNLITGNTVLNHLSGGGISCLFFSAPTISGNTITDNLGSGIRCSNLAVGAHPKVTISDNLIAGNTSSFIGGGICCMQVIADIHGNTVTNNRAGQSGGGIYLLDANVKLHDNLVASNTANDDGGGIFIRECAPTLSNNTISGNTAEGKGGGIFCKNTGGVFFTHNAILENSAGDNGGGIRIYNNSPNNIRDTLLNNTISGNTAGKHGGGIFCVHQATTIGPDGKVYGLIANNTISQNTAVGDGGGIYCVKGIAPIYANNTLSGNEALRGGGICCIDSSHSPTVVNSILWGNNAPAGPEIFAEGGDLVSVHHSDVQGGWPGEGNLDELPLFVDPSGDYHLTALSPCCNSGDNAIVIDFDFADQDFEGDPRIAWQGMVDMGADEFFTHLYYTGEAIPGGSIEIKLVGIPGTWPVNLFLGSGVLAEPIQHRWGEVWIDKPWHPVHLPVMPATGLLVLPVSLSLDPTPYDLPLQGIVGHESDSITNPCVVQVR